MIEIAKHFYLLLSVSRASIVLLISFSLTPPLTPGNVDKKYDLDMSL